MKKKSRKLKTLINKYVPKVNLQQCTQCNGYHRQMIILNGALVCHGCYNKRYADTKNFHLC